MGQAFRRASGRIRAASELDATSSSKPKIVTDHRPPPPPPTASVENVKTSKTSGQDALDVDNHPGVNADNILEERDPKYDAMLGQMHGRITSKPGGKLEMGESFVVDKYNRPMPKLRNTKPDSNRYEERPVPAGTLNVAQLRHVILLYEGKADDHNGPMDIQQIAEKYRLDAVQVQKILQFISTPPEDSTKEIDRLGR